MSRITKAVIPAAGLGTRLKPISNYLPKPMLPLGKKPVLQHIVDELRGAGINEIAVVTRREYKSIFDYFGDDPEITFIEDNTRSGPGGAILKAEKFVEDEEFLVVFSDAPVLGTNRAIYLEKLIDTKVNSECKGLLSIYPIPKSEVNLRGVVCFDEQQLSYGEVVRLTDILEKPSKGKGFRLWASACRYVFDAELFDVLKSITPDDKEERQLTPAIRKLIKNGVLVGGYPLSKELERHDTGNFEDYFKAFRSFSLSEEF